jgi:hypothetical protein
LWFLDAAQSWKCDVGVVGYFECPAELCSETSCRNGQEGDGRIHIVQSDKQYISSGIKKENQLHPVELTYIYFPQD